MTGERELVFFSYFLFQFSIFNFSLSLFNTYGEKGNKREKKRSENTKKVEYMLFIRCREEVIVMVNRKSNSTATSRCPVEASRLPSSDPREKEDIKLYEAFLKSG